MLEKIVKPEIDTVELKSDGKYGKFVLAPLERGYGITLGNSLRRVLLSSLPGVAVNAVKIDGVHHELSTIPGVKEDVTEIILAIKGLTAKLYGDGPKVVYIEAEGECEEGKRLVIDTVLNRVDSEYFPGTVYEVIYQPNQFSSMWNGRVDRCEVREDICELVYEELESRTNYDVVFFTAGEYSAYGVPMFQVGNHYFSKYE